MGNIISLLQEIFMLKEDTVSKVGLSGFKDVSTPVERPERKPKEPQALKISELIRKNSY